MAAAQVRVVPVAQLELPPLLELRHRDVDPAEALGVGVVSLRIDDAEAPLAVLESGLQEGKQDLNLPPPDC